MAAHAATELLERFHLFHLEHFHLITLGTMVVVAVVIWTPRRAFFKQHCGKSELSIPTTTHTACVQLTPLVHCTAVQPLLQRAQARAKLRARSDWAPSLSSDCFPHLQCAVQTVRALIDFEASWLYRQQRDLRDTSRCRCTVVALTATDGRTASKTRPTSPCVFTVPSPIHDGSRPTVAQFHFGPFDFGTV